MTDRTNRARRDAIRAEYAAEEAESAEAEAVENEQAVVSVRVPASLAEALKAKAATELSRHRLWSADFSPRRFRNHLLPR
jgi:hypothetical protein